jgi:cell shape-determining protein MreC
MLFTWFMLTGLILLFAPQEFTGKFQLAFVHVFRWPLSLGGDFALTARTQQPVKDASERLDTQYWNYVANLEQALNQQRQELQKLSGLYNTYVWEGVDFALADVVTRVTEGSRNELTVSTRKPDGLAKGQLVLGDESVIGTISEVFHQIGKADVKLITDSTSKMAVKIGNMRGIMIGTGNNSARIEMLKLKSEIKIDENVFALGRQGLVDAPIIVGDAPIIVGKVSRCERNTRNASLWDVTVEPVCDIQNLEDVAVIIMNPQK